MRSSSARARPAGATGPAATSAGSGSTARSRTAATGPSPTSSGPACSTPSSPRTSTASTRPPAPSTSTELHGNLDRVVCLTCGDRTDRDCLHERLAEANPGFVDLVLGVAPDGSRVTSQIRPDGDIVLDDAVTGRFHLPVCLVCGSDTLKPDVVFFGESVPKDTVESVLRHRRRR